MNRVHVAVVAALFLPNQAIGQQPDLIPQSITCTDCGANNTVQPGHYYSVTYQVRNGGTGTASVSGGWNDCIHLSRNTTYNDGDDIGGPCRNKNNVAAGATYSQSVAAGESDAVFIPNGWPAGTSYLLLKADAPNFLSESNESNNLYSLQITVQAPIQYGSVAGTVKDANSHLGIPNAAVALTGNNNYNTTTDGNGNFSFGSNNIVTGSYTITASATNYNSVNQTGFPVNANQTSYWYPELLSTQQIVATPVVAPASGNYTGSVSVTITCATSGATIRYTTDGSDPTGSSPVYPSGGFSIPGPTTVTVKARGYKAGYVDSAVGSATYVIAATPDSTPPSITITSPTASSTYTTNTAALDIAGTASDNVGVTQVVWSNDRGGSGICAGTTSWSKTGIQLQPGQNVITVTARDVANNTGTDVLTITRNTTESLDSVISRYRQSGESWLLSSTYFLEQRYYRWILFYVPRGTDPPATGASILHLFADLTPHGAAEGQGVVLRTYAGTPYLRKAVLVRGSTSDAVVESDPVWHHRAVRALCAEIICRDIERDQTPFDDTIFVHLVGDDTLASYSAAANSLLWPPILLPSLPDIGPAKEYERRIALLVPSSDRYLSSLLPIPLSSADNELRWIDSIIADSKVLPLSVSRFFSQIDDLYPGWRSAGRRAYRVATLNSISESSRNMLQTLALSASDDLLLAESLRGTAEFHAGLAQSLLSQTVFFANDFAFDALWQIALQQGRRFTVHLATAIVTGGRWSGQLTLSQGVALHALLGTVNKVVLAVALGQLIADFLWDPSGSYDHVRNLNFSADLLKRLGLLEIRESQGLIGEAAAGALSEDRVDRIWFLRALQLQLAASTRQEYYGAFHTGLLLGPIVEVLDPSRVVDLDRASFEQFAIKALADSYGRDLEAEMGNLTRAALVQDGPRIAVTSLCVPPGAGVVSISPQKDYYSAGESITVSAVASPGFFVAYRSGQPWSGDAVAIVLSGNLEIPVKFAPVTETTFTLATSVVGGHGVVYPATANFKGGIRVQVNAYPEIGFKVGRWMGLHEGDGDTAAGGVATVNITRNKSISVEFAPLVNLAQETEPPADDSVPPDNRCTVSLCGVCVVPGAMLGVVGIIGIKHKYRRRRVGRVHNH
ncbi:MAG: chitobiase/beta-hexosaminidase C-terminal domain-containing protein [Phycisphaerae bacterium]|nr:chitobiase/beta-hexosaminidase C-terminal domain-containing protein [Phycisphaerae bacterium]MCK6497916.1 chitobiase/beta-hexosaminidase C-terminal domain-containing protein [Nitrospira sp.]